VSKLDTLLTELDAAFGELTQAIEGLNHEQMLKKWYDGWNVRDILGHITGWHHEMDDALERIARGERPVPEGVDYSDSDAWNARFTRTWESASPEAMVAELDASKKLFVSAARQVPEEKFEEGRAAHRILTGTGTNHYREHAPAILEWRKQQGI